MAFELPDNDLPLVKATIRLLKRYVHVLEHAKSHLEQIAEEEQDEDTTKRSTVEVEAEVKAKVKGKEPKAKTKGVTIAVTPEVEVAAVPPPPVVEPPVVAPAVTPPAVAAGRAAVTPPVRDGVIAAAQRRPKPTIMQIAQEFHISTATVSRILRARLEGSGNGEGPMRWESQDTAQPIAR